MPDICLLGGWTEGGEEGEGKKGRTKGEKMGKEGDSSKVSGSFHKLAQFSSKFESSFPLPLVCCYYVHPKTKGYLPL